jgi:hypothetical protein
MIRQLVGGYQGRSESYYMNKISGVSSRFDIESVLSYLPYHGSCNCLPAIHQA